MKSKKLITSLLTVSMLASTVVPAFAAEPNEVVDPLPNEGYSSVTLEVKDSSGGSGGETPDNPDIPPVDPTDIIIATVPVELPIVMDLEGNVTVPTDAKIINHSTEKGIKVTKISAALESDWAAADYSDDFTTKADNTKELGMSLRGDTLKADGTFPITDGNWNIAKDNNLPLNMGAKLPKQTETAKTKIATVGFTIDWSGLDGADGGSDPDAGKDNSGGSGEVNPPEEVTYTVSFTTDGNGILEGDTTATIKGGEPAPFPTAKPSSIRYEHTGWVDTTTNNKIEPTTPITSDTTIKAVFSERAASPKNWFTSSNGTITGLSDEYLNMVDAPTDLVIPNNIGGSTIKSIGANAFANKDLITSIVIPDTITSIAADAFSGCTSITELNLDYVAPYRMQNAPFGLTLKKINWGTTEIWDSNPLHTSELAALNLSFDSSTGAIKASSSTICGDIHLPTSIDGVKVTTIDERAFNNCSLLTAIKIPDSVKSIGKGAFFGCTGITNIAIPDTVTTIGDAAFSGCTGLTAINIPDTVTTIGNSAFYNCTELTNIAIPDTVTTIGDGAFYSCTGLTAINIPNSVTTIGSNAFSGCTGLTTINIPNGVTSIGSSAFSNCRGLSSITIPYGITKINNLTFGNCTGLTTINIPDTVTTIANLAFSGCTGVTTINIPNSVTSIENKSFYNVPHITYNGTATGAPWGALSIN